MKTKLALGAVAAAIAVFSQGAFAQASAPANRADVKAGAQAKAVAPAGEKPTAAPSTTSDKSREQRKETTKADKASGKLAPAGDAGGQKEDKAMKSTGTETTRDERKAKTKSQQKAKQIPAAGEKPNQ
jgi:cytoskeletal protein RodZ